MGAADFTFQSLDFCFPFGCPQLLNFRATSELHSAITAECVESVCPPGPELSTWNSGEVQPQNNCYNYATNGRGGCFGQPGSSVGNPIFLPRLADSSCGMTAAQICEAVSAQARADGLAGPFDSPEQCGDGSCVVYLVASDSWCDYHWYRLNADGSWSHKPGGTAARGFDPGDPPSFTDRNYTLGCRYFCVPCDAAVEPPFPCPPARLSNTTGSINVTSGVESPSFPILDQNATEALLAALARSQPASAPPVPPGLGFSGYTLQGGSSDPSLPARSRLWNGLIEISTPSGFEYRSDVGGAYRLMQRLATGAGLEFLLPCEIADFNGDGGIDSDDVIGFFGAWDAGNPDADFNGDFGVDSDDVIGFFARWDRGC
jgi:hypothetical protein